MKTEELKKEIEKLNLELKKAKRYYSHQNLIANREKLKAELKGRQDVLKEVEEVIDGIFTESKFTTYCDFENWLRTDIKLLKRLVKELKQGEEE